MSIGLRGPSGHSTKLNLRKRRRFFGATFQFLALVLCPLLVFGAEAPPAKTSLKITPEAVTIEAGASATVIVTNDDGGAKPDLKVVDATGVQSKAPDEPDAQSATGPFTWLVKLTPSRSLTTDALVTIELLRDSRPFVFGQIKVTPKAAPSVATSVQGELQFDDDALLDGRRSAAVLRLTNLTDYDLKVSTPIPLVPSGITITSSIPTSTQDDSNPAAAGSTLKSDSIHPEKFPAMLPARGVLLTDWTVSIKSDQTLSPGKYTIGLVAPLERVSADLPWSGQLVVSKEISAGIPGMTELQTVLQIPSLLLLPGLLFVVSFHAVRALGEPARPDQDALSRLALAFSPWLWISAITISGIIVFLYPLVTSLFFPVRHDILYGYSLVDLITVWIGSISLGIIIALLVMLGACVLKTIREQSKFQAKETPLPFLARLKRIGVGYGFPFVLIHGRRLYRLDPKVENGNVWAAPAMRFTPRDENFDARGISAAIRAGDISALTNMLAEDEGSGLIKVKWDNFGEVDGPTAVPASTFANIDPGRTDSIVQEEP